MTQNLQKLAFFNEYVQARKGQNIWKFGEKCTKSENILNKTLEKVLEIQNMAESCNKNHLTIPKHSKKLPFRLERYNT